MYVKKRQVFWPTLTLAGLVAASQAQGQASGINEAQNATSDANATMVVTVAAVKRAKHRNG